MNISNASNGADYTIGDIVGETPAYRVYTCLDLEEGKQGMVKIAATTAQNGMLDREVYVLQSMRLHAELLQNTYVSQGNTGKLNYQFCFPRVVDSFIAKDQGGRRINVLSVSEIIDTEIGELAPIGRIAERESARVDPRTSAWILGKLLKLLGFTHSQGITATVNEENILLNRKEHYIALFDWSDSTIAHDEKLPTYVATEEISAAAKEVIKALGGNLETGAIPDDEQLTDGRYEEFLWSLASGNESDASKAHAEFYALIDTIWPKGFHPYTAYPLE